MQSASPLRHVSPRKTPREGQRRVVEFCVEKQRGTVCVQLPTGYGKTLAAALTFTALHKAGVVNRLLYLVPTAAQLNQFCNDGEGDFLDAGLAGSVPFDVSYSPAQAVARHRENRTAVFAATIQSVTSGAAGMAVREMLQTGSWMVVIDEYHHYGIDKSWSRAALDLLATFTLAMSATPNRRNQDSAFGEPQVKVTYRQAVDEGAVKALRLHSYEYRVDAITVNGEPVSFSTSDIVNAAGSADPTAIDKYIVDKKLRWSPKYISPLVSIPIERLLSRRRGLPLQALVGGMGCLHAKMLCEQIRSMFGDILRVDWVGTGPHGRTDAENKSVLRKFCPPKVNGVRRAKDIELDVLVHVGVAGEGLDSVYVSEVIHLNKATVTNQNHQENGRAARPIPGAPSELQEAVINVDSASPYAEWSGARIMDLFDADPGEPPPEEEYVEREPRELDDLPEEPTIVIADCQLESIDKGDPEVKGCATALVSAGGFDPSILNDPNHQIWDAAIMLRRRELLERARGQDGMATLYQLRKAVQDAVAAIASRTARIASVNRPERSTIGDLMKRINSEMKRRHGAPIAEADEEGLRARYAWLKRLEKTLKCEGIPQWLR